MKRSITQLFVLCVMASIFTLVEAAFAADGAIMDMLDKNVPYSMISPDVFGKLGDDLKLPDSGKHVTELADKAPGGAFDPRDLQ
jgi:hypothetical protein